MESLRGLGDLQRVNEFFLFVEKRIQRFDESRFQGREMKWSASSSDDWAFFQRRDYEFSTSVYRKPTFTGQYLHWNSFSRHKRKINIIGTLVHRAFMVCSKGKLDPELDKILSILLENGYPENLIKSTIK